MSITATLFHIFKEDLHHGEHDFSSDVFKVALLNAAPDAGTDEVFGDLSEIAAGYGYPAGGLTITLTTSGQSGGTYYWIIEKPTITPSGGNLGPFKWAAIYNSSNGNKLCWFYTYEAWLALVNGVPFILDVNTDTGAYIA